MIVFDTLWLLRKTPGNGLNLRLVIRVSRAHVRTEPRRLHRVSADRPARGHAALHLRVWLLILLAVFF